MTDYIIEACVKPEVWEGKRDKVEELLWASYGSHLKDWGYPMVVFDIAMEPCAHDQHEGKPLIRVSLAGKGPKKVLTRTQT